MNASKESAAECLLLLPHLVTLPQPEVEAAYAKIRDFLTAAQKRLPSEASIARDKERRKKKTA